MIQLLLLPLLLDQMCAALTTVDQPVTVCPPSVGCLKGTYRRGYQSERFEAFMGIPYALPPVGDLRFSVSSPDSVDGKIPLRSWIILFFRTPR